MDAILSEDKGYNKSGLHIVRNEKGFYFYYKNILLFQHDLTIPFLTAILPGKNVPLYQFNILQCEKNDYAFEFFQNDIRITCHVTEKDGVIVFSVHTDYSGMILSLYKKNDYIIRGVNQFSNSGLMPEKKLCFYIEDKYFFQNANITQYEIKFLDRIFLTAMQGNICFLLDTVNTPEEMKKMFLVNTEKFKVFKETKLYEMVSDLYSISDQPKEGIIIKDCDDLKIIPFLSRNYGNVLFCLKNEIVKDSHFYTYFSEGELVKKNNGNYKIDFEKPNAIFGFKTIVRKYFDTPLAGIYVSSEGSTDRDYEVMRRAIESVLSEYTKKVLLFDRLSLCNDYCGYYVLKDRKKIFLPDVDKYYTDSGEFFLAAEVNDEKEINSLSKNFGVIIINKTI